MKPLPKNTLSFRNTRETMDRSAIISGARTMKAPRQGDVFYADVNGKKRPIVIVDARGDSVRYLKCTTKCHEYNSPYTIRDVKIAGLDGESFVNRGSTYVMSRSKLINHKGRLSNYDMNNLKAVLSEKDSVSNDIYDDGHQRRIQQKYDW